MSAPTTTAPVVDSTVNKTKPAELPTQTPETSAPVESTTASETPAATEENKVEDTKPVEATTATEDKPVEAAAAKEEKPVEPVTSGVLGYKAPGLVHQFKFSKRYFWLGDEPFSTQSLSHYLRGTEAKIAHPVAAWSSQTGKGLLYLVKSESEKSHPQDVILLADVTDLKKDSPHEFSFKAHNEKHAFKAANDAERNGWYSAIEKAIAEAKEAKEEIHKSEGYQESVKHLGKPAALAGGVAAGGAAAGAAAAKKSEDKPEEVKAEEKKEQTEGPARANSSSSSSSSDAEKAVKKAEKKNKSKSRSASRGKRSSIFGSFLGKKEEHEAKKEVKEEKKEEAKAEDKPVAEAAAVTGAAAAPAEETTEPKPAETTDAAVVAPTTAAETKPEETKEETPVAPKPSKRNSIFGSIYQKVRSPTTEKKESEVAPIVPPKDQETKAEEATPIPATTTEVSAAPKIEEPVESKPVEAAPVAAAATTPAEKDVKKVETPKKEKESFFGSFLNKARAKSPAAGKRDVKEAEKASAVDAPAVPPKDEESKPTEAAPLAATGETPAATATTDATTEPKVDTPALASATEAPKTEETPVATDNKATTPKENRRKSLFASFGSGNKKEGETTESEKPFEKLGAMFRKPSQAIRGSGEKKDAKKENVVPEKAAEEKPVETTPATTTDATKPTEAEKPQESIGDVTADSVEVGKPQQTNPTVSATA
ncbi:hypothetical protein B9Z65_2487 [Elsinoe australis]|uniref:PH domain-containing protein n=1 Tax=Elsinoe australis TaxID=40998 RepID=A0A2P7ZAV3_9PEZI|nr:hypothetical protein B9Z65_2487 [Elsinoe australis]